MAAPQGHRRPPAGSRLATDVRWGRRRLITRFKQQVGLPPKTAARMARLDGGGGGSPTANPQPGLRSRPTVVMPTKRT